MPVSRPPSSRTAASAGSARGKGTNHFRRLRTFFPPETGGGVPFVREYDALNCAGCADYLKDAELAAAPEEHVIDSEIEFGDPERMLQAAFHGLPVPPVFVRDDMEGNGIRQIGRAGDRADGPGFNRVDAVVPEVVGNAPGELQGVAFGAGERVAASAAHPGEFSARPASAELPCRVHEEG